MEDTSGPEVLEAGPVPGRHTITPFTGRTLVRQTVRFEHLVFIVSDNLLCVAARACDARVCPAERRTRLSAACC